MAVVGIDFGGTGFRKGLVQRKEFEQKQKPNVLGFSRIPSPKMPPAEVANLIAREALSLRDVAGEPIDAIGLSFAGPVDPWNNNEIVRAPNIWWELDHIQLGQMISQAAGIPVLPMNDMTAAGRNEARFGLGIGINIFLIVTVSSGIGSKLFINGNPLIGRYGIGGELGHYPIIDKPGEGRPCGCGDSGCLEAAASGMSTEARVRDFAHSGIDYNSGTVLFSLSQGDPNKISNLLIAQAFQQGDPLATKFVNTSTRLLAMAIRASWAFCAFDRLIVMGGFALGMGDPFFESLRTQIQRFGLFGVSPSNEFLDQLIVRGSNDDQAGVIGAAVGAAELVGY